VTDSTLPTVEEMSEQLQDALVDADQWLWEPTWKLNQEFPAVDLADKVNLMRQVILSLTLQGTVELWRGQWPAGPVAPLSKEEMGKILAQDTPWHDPEQAELLVVIEAAGPSYNPVYAPPKTP